MHKTARLQKRRLSLVTALSIIFAMVFGQATAFAANPASTEGPLTLVSELRVGEGTINKEYSKLLLGQNNKIFVTEIDLNNPYVKVAPIYGKEGKIDKQPLTKMADENGAVVAINANFFHLTQRPAPFAMQYKDGELITSQSELHDWMVFSVDQNQTAQIGSLGFTGQVSAANGATFPIFNLNKEVHNTHAGNSHENRLNLYNSRWKDSTLGTLEGKTGVVEVVLQGETVIDIRIDQPGVVIPPNGYVLMGHGTAAQFLLNNVKLGDSLGITYDVTPDATSIAQAIGAHALLVDQGMPVAISPKTDFSGSKSARARSAIGISQDGKKVYFIAVEKSANSQGVNLDNFARIIAELGVYRAANLDGGGSTTVVSRMPGDHTVTLLNTPDGGPIRSVPDGIAVYNLAPQGKLVGMKLNSGPLNVLTGSKVTYTLKGYDEHVLPYNVYQHPIAWTAKNAAIGSFVEGRFVATASGTTEIYAMTEGVTSNPITVNVFGGKDIEKIDVSPSVLNILPNSTFPLSINVKTKTGVTFKATADNVKWTIEGVDGTMDGLTYHSGSGVGVGKLVGNIDGVTFSLPIYQGSMYGTFNTLDYVASYHHSHYPSNNPGSFVRIDQSTGEPIFRGVASMKLTYNFLPNTFDETGKTTDAVEAAYGNFSDTHFTFPKDALGFGVWVYGDNSNYAVKAQIKDQKGNVHYVTLAERIDWTGWKYVETKFTPEMARPVTLSNVYIVDEPTIELVDRPLTGSIYFDEITLIKPYEAGTVSTAKTVKPNSKDKATNLAMSIGQLELNIIAADIEKRASEYTVSPITAGKHNQPIVGDYPLAYGFNLNMTERDQNAKSTFPVLIMPKYDVHFSLLHWSEAENKWNRIIGYPVQSGALRFDITGSGVYIPVKNDQVITFRDIATHWAKASIAEMAHQGIIKGVSETEYNPSGSLSRGETATLLYRIVEKHLPELATELLANNTLNFVDPIPDWAQQGAIAAVNLGVMQGVGQNKFASTDVLTRDQLATIIARMVTSLELTIPEAKQNTTITDQKDVPDWATAGVKLAVEQQLFPLVEGKFMPKQKVSRGEAAYAIAQIYFWMQTR